MLPDLYRHHYQAFRQSLQKLQNAVSNATSLESSIYRDFQVVQQLFQHQLMTLDSEGLNPADAAKVQSYQTEINKQLRLLGMDVMFLGTARQVATINLRRSQISDRLDTLIRYCNAVLEE